MGGHNWLRAARRIALAATIAGGAGLTAALPAMADGTETLGPPSIDIATGTGAIAAGTGTQTQPATIDITVPTGVSIVQVLVYWEGHHLTETAGADDTITLGGASVTGDLIGGPSLFYNNGWSSAFRADVTGLGLVTTGANSISAADMDFDNVNNGVGLLVIVDDGGPAASIELVDGVDLAFINFPAPRDTTVPQTLTFAPAPVERVVDVTLFASSVEGPDFPGERPNVIEVTVDGVATRHQHLLTSFDGDEWDTVSIEVTVPASVGSITVQALSADDGNTGNLPASLAWIAGLVVAPPAEPTTTTTTTTTTTVPETTTTTPEETTTTTPEETTTTTPETTTTTPETTTTTPETTTIEPTTTAVGVAGPTTTSVAVAPPTTVAQLLPPTGADAQRASMLIGAALVGLGTLALFSTRRRTSHPDS